MSLSKKEGKALDMALGLATKSVNSFFKLRKINKVCHKKILLLVQFYLYCNMHKKGLLCKSLKGLTPADVDNGLGKTIIEVQKLIEEDIIQVGDFELLCASLSVTVILSDMD